MARFVYHGFRDAQKASALKRIWQTIFPPRPVMVRAAHYPHSKPESNFNTSINNALLKAHRASNCRRRFTLHFSSKPRWFLEMAVVGAGATLVISSIVYWQLSRDEVFLTHRERTMAFSWDFEKRYFGNRAEKIVEQRDIDLGPRLMPDEDPRSAVVHEIARRIIQIVEQDFPEIHNKLDWRVVVRKNPTINAFCEPGGSLTVFTGLVDCMINAQREHKVENARDAIAAVVAHEISHGLARHGMEKLSWLPIQLPFLMLTPDVDILYEGFNLVFKLPHSRECESEADFIGVNLMARAGFDPREAPRMFRVLNSNGKLFEWISTHPVGDTRAREVEEVLPEDLELFDTNKDRFANSKFVWPDLMGFSRRLEEEQARKKSVYSEISPTLPKSVVAAEEEANHDSTAAAIQHTEAVSTSSVH